MKLIVENLQVEFKHQKILVDCSFKIQPGEVIGLVAPNGSGKTTLLKTLVGLQVPQSGTIILGDSNNLKNRESYLKNFFFIETNQNLYEYLTVEEHLLMVKQKWQSKITLEEATRFFEIEPFLKKKVKQLSLGMKQQLILTMYGISDAPFWLMEEPLNGLDPTNAYLFNQQMIKAQLENRSILMSSHNLANLSEICTRVLFLSEGQIIEEVSKKEKADLDKIYQTLFLNGRKYL